MTTDMRAARIAAQAAADAGAAGYTAQGNPAAQSQNGDNAALPRKRAKRPKQYRDNDAYFAMMRRILRAAGKRVVAEDPTVLAELMAMHGELDAVISQVALSLNENPENPFSWGEIGRQMNPPVTRQAARQRWGRKDG
jgi:hypothetical protein